jgi:hypothetical protein
MCFGEEGLLILLSTALADGRFIDEGVFGSNAVIDGDGG